MALEIETFDQDGWQDLSTNSQDSSSDSDLSRRKTTSPGFLRANSREALVPKGIITALKPAVKDKNRINVFLDGKFRFSLTLAQFSDANLKVGQKLDDDKIDALKRESEFGKLYQRALEYTLTRPYSVKEVRDYLRRKQSKRALDQKRYDEFVVRLKNDPEYRDYVKSLRAKTREKNAKLREKSFEEDNRFEYVRTAKTGLPTKPAAPITDDDIDRVISKLLQERALDDAQFARYFVENRNRFKGTSFKKLRLELLKKGISSENIEAAFAADEYGDLPRDERAELQKIAEKKLRKNTPLEKLIPYLLRQGFPYDLVQDVLREMDSQNSEQNPYF